MKCRSVKDIASLARASAANWSSGWSVSTLGILRTGVADTVYIGTNTFGNGDFINQRPDCVAGVDPYAHPQTITDWLNPAAFSMPAAGTFGNCGRNTIYGPNFRNVDFSVLKETKLGEIAQPRVPRRILQYL